MTKRQERHLSRLHREVRFLPCSPRCANWLRYGVQPTGASRGHGARRRAAKAHDREHLGCGGRRVLVSRKWTGKTLEPSPGRSRRGGAADAPRGRGRSRARRGDWQRTLFALTAGLVTTGRYFDPRRSTTPLYRQVLTRVDQRAVALAARVRGGKARWQRARAGPATSPLRHPDSQPSSCGGGPVKGERSESRSDTKCP